MIAKIIKKRKFCVFFLISFIIITSKFSFAQQEQDAINSIQNAQEKLIDVIILLEQGSERKVDITDLVIITDFLRDLIKEANDMYLEGKYELAMQKANSATEQLDELIDEITERLGSSKQKTKVIFSLLGSSLALFSIGIVYVFFKKIHPWFKTKQLEEYGKLVILYEETSEEIKDDRD